MLGTKGSICQASSGRAECGAKANAASRNLGCSWCQPLAVGKGTCHPQLVPPKPGGKGRVRKAGGVRGLAQTAALQLLLRAVFHGVPEPFPKGAAPRDGFSCCCTSECCWIDGMQGADLPGAGASAAVPAVAGSSACRRKGRRRALQQEPFLPRCWGGEGVLHSRGQAASSWLSVSSHSLLTNKLLRMFSLCPTGPAPLYPHPALSTSCSTHG